MAAHPQISGINLSKFRDNPYDDLSLTLTDDKHKIILSFLEELAEYRAKAVLMGCTKENPTLFFLVHVSLFRSAVEIAADLITERYDEFEKQQ